MKETADAVIYARYSSHSQRDCSIEQQVAECEEYAKQNNMRVVNIYADRHMTGTSDKRPMFQKMLQDSAKCKWSYVICWKVDRFARNRYDSATYKAKLKRNGVKVAYAKEAIPDGPEGILLESILEGSAEYYSANLAQNVRRGMEHNARACKINGGPLPFGYSKGTDGRLAINEAEADTVREIFNEVSNGTSFREISDKLNSRGIKTRTGKPWGRNSYGSILRNSVYIGEYSYGDIKISGGVPAIIEQSLFEEVGRRLKTKKNPQGRKRETGEYLLTGKLKCGHCDEYMVGISGTSKHGNLHHYYGCKQRLKKKCHKANVRRDYIETLVTEYTVNYILKPDVIEWIADAVMTYQDRDLKNSHLESLKLELSENKKALDNMSKAIEMGIITQTTRRRLIELEERDEELRNLIDSEVSKAVKVSRTQIKFWLSQFADGDINDKTFQKKVIDTFVSVVYLTDDNIKIVYNYSGNHNTQTIQLDNSTSETYSYNAKCGVPLTATIVAVSFFRLYVNSWGRAKNKT